MFPFFDTVPEVCVLTCEPLSSVKSVGKKIKSIKILIQYRETSPKSTGAAFSPTFSLPLPSLSVPLPLSYVSSISRPLLYLPLASHCRALGKAQTASDKVRMIHVLLYAESELGWNYSILIWVTQNGLLSFFYIGRSLWSEHWSQH